MHKNINENLLNASRHGDVEEVKKLITKGANTGEKDKDGMTALMLAIEEEHDYIVLSLLDRGIKHRAPFRDANGSLWNICADECIS